jgi:biopolymer transport protein ExbD
MEEKIVTLKEAEYLKLKEEDNLNYGNIMSVHKKLYSNNNKNVDIFFEQFLGER